MILELQNKLSLDGYVSEHYVCDGQIHSLGLLIREHKANQSSEELMLVILKNNMVGDLNINLQPIHFLEMIL